MNRAFQQIQQISKGYQASCILGAACELNLFSALIHAEEPLSAEELARQLRWDERGTKVLLDALCSLSLLSRTEGKYAVLPEFCEILDENHPQTMVPMIRHTMGCLRQWSQLAWTVKAGIPAPSHNSLLGAREDNRSFVLGMHSLAVRTIPGLMEKMREAEILHFRKILDLGGASGSWLWAFLAHYTHLQVHASVPFIVHKGRIFKDFRQFLLFVAFFCNALQAPRFAGRWPGG
ncbi:MAG: methyltransferase dimerization domain-containing protein, partial [Planctomycetia bacterium]|nr:methyltransferase dimerization domain-containing protein [Planctomycetia bacterium]